MVVSASFAIVAVYEKCKKSSNSTYTRKKKNRRVIYYSVYSMCMCAFSIAYFCGIPSDDIRQVMIIFTVLAACVELAYLQ